LIGVGLSGCETEASSEPTPEASISSVRCVSVDACLGGDVVPVCHADYRKAYGGCCCQCYEDFCCCFHFLHNNNGVIDS
jgi:hypothetical protein